ncbi:MAG: hypothetical protein ABIR26_00650, partial [Ramlibacter sp.]
PLDPLMRQAGDFEKACDYCGARFEVAFSRVPGGNAARDFACPECGKAYEVRAASQPAVRLVMPRTDGKADRYQETMF